MGLKKTASFALIMVLMISCYGCGGGMSQRINRLSISMEKEDVRNLFGNRFQARASKVDENGNVLDLWEFQDKKGKQVYQIFFLNNRVSQWGKLEDLKAFPALHAPALAR